jgi:formylglycine-generating enzyme required for sulfatase activity
MGCTASNQFACLASENPTHSVTLTQAFYLGRYEVTQGQWVARMGSNPSSFQGYSDSANRPVEQVSWTAIQGYLSATNLRLPSEAEWEYAYRAGTTTAFHSMPGYPNGTNDDNQAGTIAWYSSNSGDQTRAVGGKAANGLGLHDMAGNVWEWVNDWYAGYSSGAQTNPLGPVSGTNRVVRGGPWTTGAYAVRSSHRGSLTPGTTFYDIGFRVARDVVPAPAPTVSSVSPASGSTLGGTAITITGANLTGASSVTVGGVAATSVVVVSPTSITAVTPAGTDGAKTVAVTTAGGMATLTNGFTYVVPSVWYTVIQQTVDAAVVTNVAMRNAITASGLPWRVRDTATQMEMLLVPAGTFVMGCTAANQSGCLSSENPTHSVTLTQAFYLGRYEVTQGQWVAKMGSNPSFFQGASYPDAANRPVEQVSWTTIQSYVSANGMRLPSEAEWEYACRAGTTTAFNNGSSDDATVGNIAWYNQNSGSQTHVVGGKAANALGLFDMSGNVWEWVNDWYGSYSVSPSTNPLGPVSGTARVLRGGSWLNGSDGVRSSSRGFNAPANTPDTVGFRVARDAPPPPAPTVSSVSPTSGSTLGGTAITITGTALTGASSVTVAGVAATSVVVVSPTSITAVTPAGAAGAKNVAVTTAGGTASLTNGFTYVVPAPTVSSVSPASGSTFGGTAITITGANLTGASSVTVGGVAATSVVVVSSTSITAVTPAGAAGAKNVAVTTAGGTASLTNGFTYQSIIVPTWATLVEAMPDPAVVTDSTLRAAITASGLAWRVRDTATQMEMLLVPPGTFTMGCTASNQYGCESDENPTHSVTLTQAFYLGRYEVTQGQWVARMGSNPSSFQGASYPDAANRPVERVSWNTIQGYLSATGMRLPSEAEWEYACRAGTTTAFNNGSSDDASVGTIAWYNVNSGNQTHVVGGKAANALGLFDMSGNVWEWVNDWYDGSYYSVSPSTNPLGPVSGTTRVLRGGSWAGDSNFVRSSYRLYTSPSSTIIDIGFRVARAP